MAQCWTAGLAAAKQILKETNLFDPYDDLDFNAIQRKEKDTTMLRPKGVRVGTQLPSDASGGGGGDDAASGSASGGSGAGGQL